jgi:hypothetical protein
VAAEDCKPNKSLRTTIKVFLRTEEKKREALRVKDLKNTPPATPATPDTPIETSAASTTTLPFDAKDVVPQPPSAEPSTTGDQGGQIPATDPPMTELPTEAQQDIPQPSIEVTSPAIHFSSAMLTPSRKLRQVKNQPKKVIQLPTKLEIAIRRY